MKTGRTLKSGDVILAKVQYTDTFEVKTRPAVVLFAEYDNIIVAGITSNPKMQGIPLTKKEGAIKDGVIKLNYIFTIARPMVSKVLFRLTPEKKKIIFRDLTGKLEALVG